MEPRDPCTKNASNIPSFRATRFAFASARYAMPRHLHTFEVKVEGEVKARWTEAEMEADYPPTHLLNVEALE